MSLADPDIPDHFQVVHLDLARDTELPEGSANDRYTLAGPGRINGVVTITDPDTFSRPWSTAFTLVKKPGYELKESVCVRDHRM